MVSQTFDLTEIAQLSSQLGLGPEFLADDPFAAAVGRLALHPSDVESVSAERNRRLTYLCPGLTHRFIAIWWRRALARRGEQVRCV